MVVILFITLFALPLFSIKSLNLKQQIDFTHFIQTQILFYCLIFFKEQVSSIPFDYYIRSFTILLFSMANHLLSIKIGEFMMKKCSSWEYLKISLLQVYYLFLNCLSIYLLDEFLVSNHQMIKIELAYEILISLINLFVIFSVS